jgi:tyrosine-protein kinase Etk/Wzc
MPHASSPSESYSRGAAVENGIVAAEMQLDSGSRTEGDAIDLLLVLARYKKRILQITLAAALLALAVALLLPNMYTATTTILPPQQKQSALNAMVGQLGALAKLGGMTDLGLKNPADLFVAMLKSRTIEDALVNRFDLRKVYGERRYEDARKKLEGRSSISAGDEGLISISVGDRDPKRAAELANAYVDELHSLNQNLAITEAGQRRLFYEQKLDAEREELARADLALEHGQEKSGLIEPEAQGKAIIASVADMRAQIAIREVQLQAMRSYATENNPDLKRAEAELAGMRGQLAKLESDTGVLGNGNLAVPTRKLPQAALEYIRRARDLRYHEALYEFLVKQLEAARIDEANDAFTVQVVDHAVVPERRSSPKRMLIVVMAAGVAFLLACFGALLLEALRRKQQDPNERARLALLFHSFKFSSWRA